MIPVLPVLPAMLVEPRWHSARMSSIGRIGQLRTQGRDEEQVDAAANSAAACGLLCRRAVEFFEMVIVLKVHDSAFDFENASCQRKTSDID